jgi:hypothetical protein
MTESEADEEKYVVRYGILATDIDRAWLAEMAQLRLEQLVSLLNKLTVSECKVTCGIEVRSNGPDKPDTVHGHIEVVRVKQFVESTEGPE